MVKEYDTPAGVARQEVFRMEDWVSAEWPGHKDGGNEIRLIDDYNVVRSRRFAVEGEEDLEKIKYLLYPPSDEAISEFREGATAVARQADELGVLLVSTASSGTDMAVWLCGVQGLVYMALDKPDVFAALLDIIHKYDKRHAEILLDWPVHLVNRRAWYEGTAFWSPALYRRFFKPRLQELTTMAHQAGKLMGYIMSTGYMPLLDVFRKMDYDVHYYVDPVMGGPGTDLAKVKKAFDGEIAILEGVNSLVTLEQGTDEEIGQAVFDAVSILGPGGGFILSPVDCVPASTPWHSVEVVIEARKQVRDYPLAGTA